MISLRTNLAAACLPQAATNACGSGLKIATALFCESPLLHTGLQHILSGTPFVVAEADSGTGATPVHKEAQEPALCLIEANQDAKQVFKVVRQAKECFPKARVVALADQLDLRRVRLVLDAGVEGFCLTGAGREVLIKSLELVMLGETILPTVALHAVLDRLAQSPQSATLGSAATPNSNDPKGQKLSNREMEVLDCLRDGSSNKDIARKLDVAEATIKVHVKAVLRKIGASNRTQAAIWATAHLRTKGKAALNA
jgi:two-component system, NarL family, nitrate/nitrite response regulator NarL